MLLPFPSVTVILFPSTVPLAYPSKDSSEPSAATTVSEATTGISSVALATTGWQAVVKQANTSARTSTVAATEAIRADFCG